MLFRSFAHDFKNKMENVFCEPHNGIFSNCFKDEGDTDMRDKAIIGSIWLTDKLKCTYTWPVH